MKTHCSLRHLSPVGVEVSPSPPYRVGVGSSPRIGVRGRLSPSRERGLVGWCLSAAYRLG